MLCFGDVSFAYPDAEELRRSSTSRFTVRRPGQTLGVIRIDRRRARPTLVQLIPRLLRCDCGVSVTVDGVDVTAHGLCRSSAPLIGYVPQKGMLFSGDIASNIAYGDPRPDS
ncbi:MAG: hypothetical protein ACLTSX_00470 [Collinsella sp.]